MRALLDAGVTSRGDLDPDFWEDAARLKAALRRVSLADCYCLALAPRLGAVVVTCDHHESDAIVPLRLVTVRFVR